jgi:hypothetical protein
MHSFGISLVYPGSMGLMGMLVERTLLEGRTKLMQVDFLLNFGPQPTV